MEQYCLGPLNLWLSVVTGALLRLLKHIEVPDLVVPCCANKCRWGILPEGWFFMTWLVMVPWNSTEVVARFPQAPGRGSVNLSHLFTHHPPRIRLLVTRGERWIFDNRKVILALFTGCGCMGLPLFSPWCSKAMLAIWSERLAKGSYQKNAPPAVRLKPAILRIQIQAFFTKWAILPNSNGTKLLVCLPKTCQSVS